jgi:hypothetical protein
MAILARGGCRCDSNPVRFEYNKEPAEVHFCLCTDCTDTCGGALALIAVVERSAFTITAGEEKIRNIDTKPTCHRRYCADCGCHMFLHVPTIDRDTDVGGKPDRWVFVNSKHPMVTIPDDGLPRHPGWAASGDPVQAA